MLSGLLDNLTSAMGRTGADVKRGRVIDAFLTKHPDVVFCDFHLRGRHAPGGFIVWKFGSDDCHIADFKSGNPVAAGSYGVQLFPSREDAEAQAYGKRFGPDRVVFASTAAEAGTKTVITGIGTFNSDAPAGELTSSVYDGSFSMMVLYEDSARYSQQRS
jgi:hypothetical protein